MKTSTIHITTKLNGVVIGDNVTIGKNVTFGKHCVVHDNVMIGAGVIMGDNVILEEKCVVLSGVLIRSDTQIPVGQVVSVHYVPSRKRRGVLKLLYEFRLWVIGR